MKKLIWSAFALSLIWTPAMTFAQTEGIDDFLGLESEIMPGLKGDQKFTPPDLNEKSDWKVTEEQTIKDVPVPIKGQGHSIIPWSELDPNEWLSIDKWVAERTVKDTIPDWKVRLRQSSHAELVGKILQCKGTCYAYRGVNKARVQHLSRIVEGDEVVTEKDSVAWVFTMDGGIMRLAPQTSVSFQEINISGTEMVILARLNTGHAFWKPQLFQEEPMDDAPETDAYSLPLMVREANQEFYERLIYKELDPLQKFSEIVNLPTLATEDQVTLINNMKSESATELKIIRRLIMVAPNVTVISRNESFDLVHLTGGLSWFKRRSMDPSGTLEIQMRGYLSTELAPIMDDKWYQVEANGRSYAKVEDPSGDLQIIELLTKRIKSIELARQFWIKNFTLPLMRNIGAPEIAARYYGYSIWGVEFATRFNFLLEYTRRIETTNLRSLENLMLKLEENGEKPRRELNNDLYRVSLNHYLLGLKSRYDKKKIRVRHMSDLQYYVWILRNGKF